MSLHNVAKRLESKGRHGDTMLMHIQPTELQILEAMLGKTTRNPETGLPEAFSWKKLLAGLGAAALGVAAIPTGGLSLLGAAGLASGIGAGAATGLGLAGASMLAGKALKKDAPKSAVSEAARYLESRNEATKGGRGLTFAPPMRMLESIDEQVPDEQVPVRVDPLGRMHNWYQPPKQFAQGGQVTEEQAKETVLAMLARMQEQQQQGQPMAQGRMIKGPGTGLSDSIPARLGVGEYVIPADVVSMMGDGATDAGGRRLDELVARVRMEKTGTKKQAGKLPLRKVMQHG